MPHCVLAYQLLKSANLSNYHEKLIKAITPDLEFDVVKYQLKKTFSDASRQIPIKREDIIKTEKAFLCKTGTNFLSKKNIFQKIIRI